MQKGTKTEMEVLGPGDPRRVGSYHLLARLGGGGMGSVYLGRTAGGRNVAVKVIRSEHAADQEFRRRFRQEVAAARRVSGQWAPPVLDADTDGPQPWLATAYVPGPDLAEAVRRFGPLPLPAVRVLGAGLAAGLLSVHGVGLVHRDLKPSNVLLSLDGPRVIDFGIARAMDGTATAVTRTGSVIGSPGYMSPEQATGTVAGPPSDVFSLGAVLAAAATGRAPFGEGPTAVAVMYRVLHEQPDLDGLPDALRDIVVACLNKDPAGRPTPQQIRAHMLPDPDATIPPRGWLPPAISEAVARLATELLHLDAPSASAVHLSTSPSNPHSSWPTMPATQFGPHAFTPAPVPLTAQRPRRRALVVTTLVAAGIAAGAVLTVLANGSPGEGTGSSASTQNAPTMSNPAAPATSAGTGPSSPTGSSPSTTSEPASKTSATAAAASGDVPVGMLGTWQYDGGDPSMPTLTVTLRQGKLGGAVGTFRMQGPDGTGTGICRATIRLATAGPDRIMVIATDPTGGAECQSSGSAQNMAIAQESAAALSLSPTDGPDTTPLELVKQN